MPQEPICNVPNCPRYGDELFKYTNGTNVTIGICYACGTLNPLQTDMGLVEVFFWNPELVIELISKGDLKPINEPRKIYKQ